MRQLAATGAMHEKYDVSVGGGGVGCGGEYAPQVGFGWSNGVALDLLAHWHEYGRGAGPDCGAS
jgi:alpha,alpha-trehalase